jgi:thioredoxin 1
MDGLGNLISFAGTYEELIPVVAKAPGLCVVTFGIEPCLPCKKLDETLPFLAQGTPGVTFIRVNVDESRPLASHFMINSIPHVRFLMKDQGGEIQDLASVIGVDLAQIEAKIQQFTA